MGKKHIALKITLVIMVGSVLGLFASALYNPVVTDDVLITASKDDCFRHQILTQTQRPVRRRDMFEFELTCEALATLQRQKSLIR